MKIVRDIVISNNILEEKEMKLDVSAQEDGTDMRQQLLNLLT